MTFETVGKFLIVSVRLILAKNEADGVTGHDGKLTSDINLIWRLF